MNSSENRWIGNKITPKTDPIPLILQDHSFTLSEDELQRLATVLVESFVGNATKRWVIKRYASTVWRRWLRKSFHRKQVVQ